MSILFLLAIGLVAANTLLAPITPQSYDTDQLPSLPIYPFVIPRLAISVTQQLSGNVM